MTERFRLTLGQLNPTAGDLAGNAALARSAWQAGHKAGAQMVALPEMFLTGGADARLTSAAILNEAKTHIKALAVACADGPALGIGAPWQDDTQLYDAYLVLEGGQVTHRILKHHIGRDELALFDAGPISGPCAVAGLRIGCLIGADATGPDMAETLEETGADILLVPTSAPYHRGVMDLRFNQTVARVIETELPLIYLNQMGGQDDTVFDGGSFALNRGGRLTRQLPAFAEAVTHIDLERGAEGWQVLPGEMALQPGDTEKDYCALILGLQDHLRKNGRAKAVLGVTGDSNSAVAATIAADALGSENLTCVFLQGDDTTAAQQESAKAMAKTIGCSFANVALPPVEERIFESLFPLGIGDSGSHLKADLRARLRALLLQTISDAERALPLGCALSGAPVDIYNVLRDLSETQVADLRHWRDGHHRSEMRDRPLGPLPSGPPVRG